jgi:hypothetical protein
MRDPAGSLAIITSTHEKRPAWHAGVGAEGAQLRAALSPRTNREGTGRLHRGVGLALSRRCDRRERTSLRRLRKLAGVGAPITLAYAVL